jgi:uncharacterized protein Yka (UPF0111/DUF47 family)
VLIFLEILDFAIVLLACIVITRVDEHLKNMLSNVVDILHNHAKLIKEIDKKCEDFDKKIKAHKNMIDDLEKEK